MPTPPFKLSDKFSAGDKVRVCTSRPVNDQAEFSSSVSWADHKVKYLGQVLIIIIIDDDDATMKLRPLDGSVGIWACHSWVIKHTAIELISAQNEGQRQIDYANARRDFNLRVAFGWEPPPEKWKLDDIVVVQPRTVQRNAWGPDTKKTIGEEGKVIEKGPSRVRIEFKPRAGETEPYKIVYFYLDLKWKKRPSG